jgi:hypothetical protein
MVGWVDIIEFIFLLNNRHTSSRDRERERERKKRRWICKLYGYEIVILYGYLSE